MPESTNKVWRDYDQAALNAQYDQRTLVPNVADYIEHDRAESHRVRENLDCQIDIRYGQSEDETLDFFPTDDTGAPTIVFYHGGAWTRLHKDSASYQAEGFVTAGANFVSVNFSLAPAVTLDKLIRQCRGALKWVHDEAAKLNIDPARLYVAGHSSGAHIAAMMLVTDWSDRWNLPSDVLRGALLVSGIYDLEPVRLSARNEYLSLDAAAARRNSPLHQLPENLGPIVLGYGKHELSEFKRQSIDFATTLRGHGHVCHELLTPGCNHFEVGEELARPNSPLLQKMFDIIELTAPTD